MTEAREDMLTPWGPFEMGGFEGCTDANRDNCACATDVQPTCRICGKEIEPGELSWSRQWPCYIDSEWGTPTQLAQDPALTRRAGNDEPKEGAK